MTPPARRDGIPDKQQRDSKIVVSNAKPARIQHVSKKKQKATAESVARDLGANWLVDDEKPKGERLQKVLAKAGVASRRHAEVLIDAGRVEVNGNVILKQGVKVNPAVDVIRVDGVRVNVNEDQAYFILINPAECSRRCQMISAAPAWATWFLKRLPRASAYFTWAAWTRIRKACSF